MQAEARSAADRHRRRAGEESSWGWGKNAIEFFAIGTAVTEHKEPSPQLPSTVFSIGLKS